MSLQKSNNILRGLFTRGLPHNVISLQSRLSSTTSVTTVAAPRPPSATSGRVHGPGRLLRSPCHALHRRRPGRVHGPARLLRSPCHALRRRHLRWILEGATIYDDSAGTSGDHAIVVSRDPGNDASAGTSGDYAIVVSRDPGSDATAMTSEDYAIIPSHNPDNGIWAGNASRQGRGAANDGAVNDVRRPPTPPFLRQQRLLSKGRAHHLIYVG